MYSRNFLNSHAFGISVSRSDLSVKSLISQRENSSTAHAIWTSHEYGKADVVLKSLNLPVDQTLVQKMWQREMAIHRLLFGSVVMEGIGHVSGNSNQLSNGVTVITDFADGGSLGMNNQQMRAAGKKWNEMQAAVILHDVLEVLIKAHRSNVVHQRLHAENILLVSQKKALTDYVMASLLAEYGQKEVTFAVDSKIAFLDICRACADRSLNDRDSRPPKNRVPFRARVSDFCFSWSLVTNKENVASVTAADNVLSFGLLAYDLASCGYSHGDATSSAGPEQILLTLDNCSFAPWLKNVIRNCLNPDAKQRPTADGILSLIPSTLVSNSAEQDLVAMHVLREKERFMVRQSFLRLYFAMRSPKTVSVCVTDEQVAAVDESLAHVRHCSSVAHALSQYEDMCDSGTMMLSCGTHRSQDAVFLPGCGRQIEIVGTEGTVLQYGSGNATLRITGGDHAIRKVCFMGGPPKNKFCACIIVEKEAAVHFHDCTFAKFPGCAILALDGACISLDNCTFHDSSTCPAIIIQGSASVIIRHTKFKYFKPMTVSGADGVKAMVTSKPHA